MRMVILFIFAITLGACGRVETSDVMLNVGAVQRLGGCHVLLHHALDQNLPIADLSYACGVPESALKEKNWWGNEAQPPAFSVLAGDCLRLEETFYCVEKIEPGKSISIRATYKQKHRTGDLLEKVR